MNKKQKHLKKLTTHIGFVGMKVTMVIMLNDKDRQVFNALNPELNVPICENVAYTTFALDAETNEPALIFYFSSTHPQAIVHEAVHGKQELMKHIGEDNPSAEFEAYTVDDIFHKLHSKIKELKKRKS